MPPMILSDESIGATKTALRTHLPQVRSSHLTEAIATGLRFRTHAALRAAIVADAALPPGIAFASPPDFDRRLQELGFEPAPGDPFGAVVAGRSLPDLPYAEFKRGDRLGNDGHYYYCQKRNRPMVMIRMARVYAEIEWDCITATPGQEDFLYGTDDGRALDRLMFDKFEAAAKDAPGKPIFLGGGVRRDREEAPPRYRARGIGGVFPPALSAAARTTWAETYAASVAETTIRSAVCVRRACSQIVTSGLSATLSDPGAVGPYSTLW